jgi:hypothetical protein
MDKHITTELISYIVGSLDVHLQYRRYKNISNIRSLPLHSNYLMQLTTFRLKIWRFGSVGAGTNGGGRKNYHLWIYIKTVEQKIERIHLYMSSENRSSRKLYFYVNIFVIKINGPRLRCLFIYLLIYITYTCYDNAYHEMHWLTYILKIISNLGTSVLDSTSYYLYNWDH